MRTKNSTVMMVVANVTRLLCVALAMACFGCASIPHRTIFITDTNGKAISGAQVIPYPILVRHLLPGSGGGNLADSRGRIELYDVNGGPYELSAPGFASRRVAFPRHDNSVYKLRRAN